MCVSAREYMQGSPATHDGEQAGNLAHGFTITIGRAWKVAIQTDTVEETENCIKNLVES